MVVAHPATCFRKAQPPVKSQRRLIRGAYFQKDLCNLGRANLGGQFGKKPPRQAMPLSRGSNRDGLQFGLWRQQAGHGKTDDLSTFPCRAACG